MKRFFVFLIILSLLLCGCDVPSSYASVTSNSTTTGSDIVIPTGMEEVTDVTSTTDASTTIGTTEHKDNETLPNLYVHFIDVGQADCIFIELPTGENILIDAGNNADSETIRKYLDSKNVTAITYLFGTHPHEDHIGALDDVINKYDIANLYMTNATSETVSFKDVLNSAENSNLQITTTKAGDFIINDNINQIYLKVMAPAKDEYVEINNYSLILKLAFIDVSFLFMADAEDIIEYEMIDSGLNVDVDVLKIGHHGSDTSTSEAFLSAVSPQYAVITVGDGNAYGHPTEKVLDSLSKFKIPTLRTDQLGTIVFRTNGKEFNVYCGDNNVLNKIIDENTALKKEKVTSETTTKTTTKTTTDDTITVDQSRQYIGNNNSKIFHETYCSSLPKERNRRYFDSRDDAINAGYKECKICNP